MSDLSKYIFDVSTTSGIEFKNLRFSKLKLLVEDGTLRPDDLVVVHGAKDQQPRPLGGLKGLNFVAVPTAPVVASGWESSGASTRSGRSPWFLWIAGGASLLGVVFILLLGVVAIFLFKKDTAETTPVLTWEMVLDDQEDAWRAYVNLQSQIGDTIGSNLPSYEEHLRELNESDQLLLSGDDESEVRDEFRFWLPEIVRRSALSFREAHLSEDSKALLSGIAERTEQTDEEVLLDWLICQTLINHGLVFEIWRHEYDLSESSGYTELVSRVGLLGEETRPILERSKTEIIRRSGERIKFRLFGGTFDIVSTLPGGEGGESGESGEGPVLGDQPIEMRLSGDYIWMRHLVFGTLEENPDGDRSVQLVREGDVWRGTWRHTIEDYADTYEIYPWARDLVVAGQIAQTNLIPDGTEAPAEEALSAAEWKRIYGRSIPLIAFLAEDGTKTGGNGTGFLIEHQERLYIVTNRHVIDGKCSFQRYSPAKTAFMAMHMTLDDTSKITALHEYRLDSSAFKVHPDGIDIAIADVTDRRADFEENFIQPLPIKFDGVPGDGDDLVWIGHPDSFTGAAEGDTPEGSAYWEKSSDLLKLTSGPLNLSKELDSNKPYLHWVEGATKMLFVESSIVSGNSGGPMLRTADWQVYGVCTMGYVGEAEGQKNGAVRAEHVLETIEHGKTWDLRTMSPQAYLARFGLPKDLAESGLFSPEQGRFFYVRAVFEIELEAESEQGYELDRMLPADELNERGFGVWVSPEGSQDDIDLYLLRDNAIVAKDVATPTESRFGRLFSVAGGFDSFFIRNESKSRSRVLVLLFK